MADMVYAVHMLDTAQLRKIANCTPFITPESGADETRQALLDAADEIDRLRPPEEKLPDFLTKFRASVEKASGHPDGKLTPCDLGACNLGVIHHEGRVLLLFDRNVDWVGFPSNQAGELADSIRAHALKARGIT